MMMAALVVCITLCAQQYQELWIIGTAVPGGAQKLTKVSDNDFKYAGRLKAGELRVATAKKLSGGRRPRCQYREQGNRLHCYN